MDSFVVAVILSLFGLGNIFNCSHARWYKLAATTSKLWCFDNSDWFRWLTTEKYLMGDMSDVWCGGTVNSNTSRFTFLCLSRIEDSQGSAFIPLIPCCLPSFIKQLAPRYTLSVLGGSCKEPLSSPQSRDCLRQVLYLRGRLIRGLQDFYGNVIYSCWPAVRIKVVDSLATGEL